MMRRLEIPKHVQSVINADGAVLLDVRRGTYFSLNDVGAEVWRRLEAGEPMSAIEAQVSRMYDVPDDILRQDLLEFVDCLKEKQLLEAGE